MNTCPAALDIAIALTALQFNKHDRKAAALLVPYLAWCAFCTHLHLVPYFKHDVMLDIMWQQNG